MHVIYGTAQQGLCAKAHQGQTAVGCRPCRDAGLHIPVKRSEACSTSALSSSSSSSRKGSGFRSWQLQVAGKEGLQTEAEVLREQARAWREREAAKANGATAAEEEEDSKRAARKAATAGLRRNLRNLQRAQQQHQHQHQQEQQEQEQQNVSNGDGDEEGDGIQASNRRASSLDAGSRSEAASRGAPPRRLLFNDDEEEGGAPDRFSGGQRRGWRGDGQRGRGKEDERAPRGGGWGYDQPRDFDEPSTRRRGRQELWDTDDQTNGVGSRREREASRPFAPRAAADEQQGDREWSSMPPRPPKEARVSLSRDLPVVRAGAGSEGAFFARRADWSRLGLKADVVAALAQLGITRPSHIQEAMLEAWASKDALHFIVADQAGSGKTLAYLLPLVQAIRNEDAAVGKPNTQPRCPRAVVLAPTTELVQQVYRVAKALSNAGARMRVAAMTGGQTDKKERDRSFRTQRETLAGGVDLVVCTPGRFTEHLAASNLNLDAAKAVVLDEVDVLMGNTTSFADQITPLRAVAPRKLRYVFVTATLSQQTAEELLVQWPDLALASGPGLHRIAAGLKEELVDCSGGDDVSLESGTLRKLEALGRSLRKHAAPRSLVFCNKIEACRDVENYLRRHFEGENLKVLVYHEAIRENLRHANMNAFLSPLPQDRSGERMVMVATDRMSRGIDSMYCSHVILFDFPRDPSEYVRRVGRTARGAGGTGVVTALVLGRQVGLARDIIGGNAKGKPIHRLPQL